MAAKIPSHSLPYTASRFKSPDLSLLSLTPDCSVLLIGSTGNGKSTLGNYLLDPSDDHMFGEGDKKETFPSAKDNVPLTQEVTSATQMVSTSRSKSFCLRVIDTPGLNESTEKDFEHMTHLIKELIQIGEIHACIFVAKFGAKIDAQYISTIEYYSKLLPSLFDRNVIIVMTDFATDEPSVKQRLRKGLDIEKIKQNVIDAIVQHSDESSRKSFNNLHLFPIDCLPMGEEATKSSLNCRDTIIDFIYQLSPIFVASLRVVKPPQIIAQDKEVINKLNEKIAKFTEEQNDLKALDSSNYEGDFAIIQDGITKSKKKIQRENDRLKVLNTDESVLAINWGINEDWKLFRTQKTDYDLDVPWEVKEVKKWTNNDKCRFAETTESPFKVKGRVTGSFMRGMYATVDVYTSKKIKYAKDIEAHQRNISDFERELQKHEAALRIEIKSASKRNQDEIEKIDKKIQELRQQITELSSEMISVNEAVKKIEEFNTSHP